MYFIDVQGTLIDDIRKKPIEGCVEFIQDLNKNSVPYMIITNNTKRDSKNFLSYLQDIGLEIKDEHYLDPLMLLEHRIARKKIAAYGSEAFIDVLKGRGYELNYEKPDIVLVAIKEDFVSDEYAQMIEFILSGARLIGMHETTLYAKNAKRYPGVGAIMKMLSFATSCEYEVVGKPSQAFYEEALSRLQKQEQNASYDKITIISDDIKGDLIAAIQLGMRSVFVLSGKYTNADEILPLLKEAEQPDFTYKNIQEFRNNL